MRDLRRNQSAALKAKVVIAALKADQTLAALAQQFDVHPNQVAQWKTRVAGARLGLTVSLAYPIAESGVGLHGVGCRPMFRNRPGEVILLVSPSALTMVST